MTTEQIVSFDDIKSMEREGMQIQHMVVATGLSREELMRTAVLGHILEGLTIAQIAERLGVHRTTVRDWAAKVGMGTMRRRGEPEILRRSATWARYKPGQVIREWRGTGGVHLRAKVIKQYAYHALCWVEAFYGTWVRLYKESFSTLITTGEYDGSEETDDRGTERAGGADPWAGGIHYQEAL
jgi:excisionase family DNA binding protein